MAISAPPNANATDHAGNSLPVFRLNGKLSSTPLVNGVKPGLTIVFRCSPFGIDPALLLQPQQRSLHGALVQRQNILAHLQLIPCIQAADHTLHQSLRDEII
jgi:hypothetical protein